LSLPELARGRRGTRYNKRHAGPNSGLGRRHTFHVVERTCGILGTEFIVVHASKASQHDNRYENTLQIEKLSQICYIANRIDREKFYYINILQLNYPLKNKDNDLKFLGNSHFVGQLTPTIA